MKQQRESYQAGVQAVVELARSVAEGLKGSSVKPTRMPFAVAALSEFADAIEQELLGKPGGEAVSAGVSDPKPPQADGERMTAPQRSTTAAE